MESKLYNQPQISVEEQIHLLQSEGLSFHDEKRASHLLQNISMFRLKSYLKPFRQYQSRQFKSNTTFEDAYTLYVRNICAHHSRLWNKKLSINALIPRRTDLPFVEISNDTKRVYYILSIILYFLQTVNPNNTFTGRFKLLLVKYPQIDVNAMGFPANWESNSLWI